MEALAEMQQQTQEVTHQIQILEAIGSLMMEADQPLQIIAGMENMVQNMVQAGLQEVILSHNPDLLYLILVLS